MQEKNSVCMSKLNEVCSESNVALFLQFFFFCCGGDWPCFKNLMEVKVAARES